MRKCVEKVRRDLEILCKNAKMLVKAVHYAYGKGISW